jgi:antitoxin MazE
VKTRIVQIGNSRGIRIPKQLLEQSGLKGEVEVRVEKNTLIIKAVSRPRAGWAEACREMRKRGEDKMLDDFPTVATQFDQEGWEW